jgi:hypothetical protein
MSILLTALSAAHNVWRQYQDDNKQGLEKIWIEAVINNPRQYPEIFHWQ